MNHQRGTLYYRFVLTLAWLFTLFVVYGSLVPFEWRVHDINEAIEIFATIRFLDLGVGSRADLVANTLIYMPPAFLWCA